MSFKRKIKYPEIIPIEEERTIQETVSRKSIPVPIKLTHNITEVNNLVSFVNTLKTDPLNRNSCILFIIPFPNSNPKIECLDTLPISPKINFFVFNSYNNTSLLENYFLLPPPNLAIYQNGLKITEIPLSKGRRRVFDNEGIEKVMNKAMKNIIEFGLRKGINMINSKNRSNMASCGSSNGDSMDIQKNLIGGSTSILRERGLEATDHFIKKFDSMFIESEEEKLNENVKSTGINGKEIGKILVNGLERGFSFMPPDSKKSSGRNIPVSHDFKGISISNPYIQEEVENDKKNIGLKEQYLNSLVKHFQRGYINSEDFVLFGLYIGLKKCSIGRLGKLKNSKSNKLIKHLINLKNNGRLEDFLLSYCGKIKLKNFYPLIKGLKLEHLPFEVLETNEKIVLKKIQEFVMKKLKFKEFKLFLTRLSSPPMKVKNLQSKRPKGISPTRQELKKFLEIQANLLFKPDEVEILKNLYEKNDQILETAFSNYSSDKDETDFIDTLNRIIKIHLYKNIYETPKAKESKKTPIYFPHQNPPDRKELNQTNKKEPSPEKSSKTSSPSSQSFLEHEATEKSSLIKNTIKSNKQQDQLSNSNPQHVIKPRPVRRYSNANNSFNPIEDYTSELADFVPNEGGNLVIPQNKPSAVSGFRSIQFEEASDLLRPKIGQKTQKSTRRTKSGRIIESSEETKKEIRSLPKTMRQGFRLFGNERNNSPPDDFSIEKGVIQRYRGRDYGDERIEESEMLDEAYDEGAEEESEEDEDVVYEKEERFLINLVKFIFGQLNIPPEITVMYENLVSGYYDDFKFRDVIFDFAKSKVIEILKQDNTKDFTMTDIELILCNKDKFETVFQTELQGKEAYEEIKTKLKERIHEFYNEEASEVLSKSKRSRSPTNLGTKVNAIHSHFENLNKEENNIENLDMRESSFSNNKLGVTNRSKSRTNLKYKKGSKFAGLTINTKNLEEKKKKIKIQKTLIHPVLVEKGKKHPKIEYEKSQSVVSKMSRVSKVSKIYLDNNKKSEDYLHELYKKGLFSIKNLELILDQLIEDAKKAGVKLSRDHEFHLKDQLQLTFIPILTLVHSYRHRKYSERKLNSPVINEKLKNEINKLKTSNPETLTMITNNFEKRRDHHTIFMTLLNYIKNNLMRINQSQHDFYMHLLRTENLRLLSAYEVYIVRKELDDFIDTLFLIYKCCFDGNHEEEIEGSECDLREKQNSILFQYKNRIRNPYYEKLIEMIKNGDEKTYELYQKYCKGMMDHFGVKGGRNKDGRVTFVQELERYAHKAIKREKALNGLNKNKQKGNGKNNSLNDNKQNQIESKEEKEKPQSNLLNSWRTEFDFYTDMYMNQINLNKTSIGNDAVKENEDVAKAIVEAFRMTRDKGEFEESIVIFIDCYLKKKFFNKEKISEFDRVLMKNNIPIVKMYQISLAMNNDKHQYQQQLNEIKELFEVIGEEEMLISDINKLIDKI